MTKLRSSFFTFPAVAVVPLLAALLVGCGGGDEAPANASSSGSVDVPGPTDMLRMFATSTPEAAAHSQVGLAIEGHQPAWPVGAIE